MKPAKQKIYCYVDETGQDPRSELFIRLADRFAGCGCVRGASELYVSYHR